MKNPATSRLSLTLAAALLAASPSAFAQNTYWIGGNNSSMSTAGNWSGGVVPTTNNTIIFNGNGTGSTDIAVTFNSNIGGTGANMTLTSLQTGNVSITGGSDIRFKDSTTAFLMESGAGAFTYSGNATGARVVLGASTVTDKNYTFTNNSTKDATFASNVSWVTGSGSKANLTFAGSGNFTVAGTLFAATGNSSTSTITRSGAGTLTLSGTNNASGLVTINTGTIAVGSATALGSGDVRFVNNGRLRSSDGTARSFSNNLTITSNATFGAAGTGNLSFSGTVNSGSGAKTWTVDSITAEFSNAISGSNIQTKAGNGTLVWSGNNSATLTGDVEIAGTGGVLRITHNNALGNATVGNTTITGGAGSSGRLELDGGLNVAENIAIGGRNNTNVALRSISGDNTLTGATTLGGGGTEYNIESVAGLLTINSNLTTPNTSARMLNISGAGNVTLGGVISDNGAGTIGVNKTGAGTLKLSGSSQYTGATTISGGVLEVTTLANGGSNSNIGNSTNAAANLVLNGGTLRFSGTTAGTTSTDRLFTVSANSTIDASGTGNATALLRFTNTGAIAWGTADQDRTLTLNAGTAAGFNNNRIDSLIQDNGTGVVSVVKTGAGTWQFLGNNTYSGTTTVSQGILRVGAGAGTGSVGTGEVILGTGAVLYINRGNSSVVTMNNLISGNGKLEKTGTGTLTLTTNNTYSGGTAIFNGAIQLDGNGTLGSTGVFIDTTGALQVNRSDSYILANNISGAGSLVQAGAGTLELTGANSFTGNVSVTGGILALNRDENVATPTVSAIGDTTVARTLTVGSGATLRFASSNAMGNAASNPQVSIVNNGGTIDNAGGQFTTLGNVTLNGGTLTGTGGVIPTYQMYSFNGAVNVTDNATISGSGTNSGYHLATTNTGFDVASGKSLTASATLINSWGVLADAGLTKTGDGTMVISGSNSYSGQTNIQTGIVRIQNSSALGVGGFNGTTLTLVQSGATLELDGSLALTEHIQVNGSGVGGNGAIRAISGSSSINDWVALMGNATIGVDSGATLTMSPGMYQATAGLAMTKVGDGTLVLTGENGYTGTTTVNAGILELANEGTYSPSTLLGDLVVNAGTARVTAANAIWGWSVPNLKQTTLNAGGTLTTASGIATTLGNINMNGGTLASEGAGDPTYGNWAFNQGAGTVSITVTDNSTISANRVMLNLGGGNTDFNVSAGKSLLVTGELSYGTGGITKTGTGAMVLEGANTYTGNTTVSNGKLVINGSTSSTSLVTVASGATLGGNGTVGGATTISGIHSPGNSPDIQSFSSDLTYTTGAEVIWELTADQNTGRGTVFDGINVAGDLDFSGATGLTLSFNYAGSTTDWTDTYWASSHLGTSGWLVYDVTGTTTGLGNLTINLNNWFDGNGIAFNSVRSGNTFSLFQDGNDVYLNYNVIPEPRAALLGGLGMLALLRRRRK